MQIDLKALAKKITEIYNKSIEENHELKALEKELADINKKLKNLLSAIENGIFNDTTNQRMKELEISKKELEEKIAQTSAQSIQPFNEEQIYTYLLSFKDINQNNKKAKQRLIDMFINKVDLFDDHVDIYFNASDDKKTHLKLKDIPEDCELFDNKTNKKQPETTKSSDCLHLAGSVRIHKNTLYFYLLIYTPYILRTKNNAIYFAKFVNFIFLFYHKNNNKNYLSRFNKNSFAFLNK